MSERQMVTSIKDVEISHKARYFFASSFIKEGNKVLDACCGVGYGVKLMSDLTHAETIIGYEKDESAVKLANFHFGSNIYCMDIFELDEKGEYDVITCFEAIEHVENPELLIKKLVETLKPGGILIVSTPNESLMPWSSERFPEHIRHFTYHQIEKMLRDNGINHISPYSQPGKFTAVINNHAIGKFMILVCSK